MNSRTVLIDLQKAMQLFVVAFLVAVFLSLCTDAAAAEGRLRLDSSKMEMPRYDRSNAKYAVSFYRDNAKYSYSSSNEKVVSVGKDGAIKALSEGRSVITITENYKGKISKGSFSLSVKKAHLTGTKYPIDTEVIAMRPLTDISDDLLEYLEHGSKNASYTFRSTDENIASISKAGKLKKVKREGTVKIEVRETYKGISETLGYIKVNIRFSNFTKNGKTIKLKFRGHIHKTGKQKGKLKKKIAKCRKKDDRIEITKFIDTVYFENVVTVYILDSMKEIRKMQKGIFPKDNSLGKNKDKVLRYDVNKKGKMTGYLLAAGKGTRYVAIADSTWKKPVYFLGYCKVVVTKAKGLKKKAGKSKKKKGKK